MHACPVRGPAIPTPERSGRSVSRRPFMRLKRQSANVGKTPSRFSHPAVPVRKTIRKNGFPGRRHVHARHEFRVNRRSKPIFPNGVTPTSGQTTPTAPIWNPWARQFSLRVFSWVLACDSSAGERYPERQMGFAGDRCALLPDGWSGRNGRCAGSALWRIRCFPCGVRPFCRSAAEIGRGIAAFSGRDVPTASSRGGAVRRACPGGFVRANGSATDISRLRGPIGMRDLFEEKMFNFNLTYVS